MYTSCIERSHGKICSISQISITLHACSNIHWHMLGQNDWKSLQQYSCIMMYRLFRTKMYVQNAAVFTEYSLGKRGAGGGRI